MLSQSVSCSSASRLLPRRPVRSARLCAVASGEKSPEVGAKIRVTESVLVYHIPRTDKTDLKGWEGTVLADSRQVQGVDLTSNLPWVVEFERPGEVKPKKFKAHLYGVWVLMSCAGYGKVLESICGESMLNKLDIAFGNNAKDGEFEVIG